MSTLKVNNIQPLNSDELILKGKIIFSGDVVLVTPTRTITPTVTQTPNLTPDCPCREIVFSNSNPSIFPYPGAQAIYTDCDGITNARLFFNDKTSVRDCISNPQTITFYNNSSWYYTIGDCCPSVTPTPTPTSNFVNCLIAKSECGNSNAIINGYINGRPSYLFSFTSAQGGINTTYYSIYWVPTMSSWLCTDLQNTVTYQLQTSSIIPTGVWLYYSGNNSGCISLYFNTVLPSSPCPSQTPTPTPTSCDCNTYNVTLSGILAPITGSVTYSTCVISQPTVTINLVWPSGPTAATFCASSIVSTSVSNPIALSGLNIVKSGCCVTPTSTPTPTITKTPTITPTKTRCCTDWFYLSSRSSGTTGTTYYITYCSGGTEIMTASTQSIGNIYCAESVNVLSPNYDGSHFNKYQICNCLPPTPTPSVCCSDWTYYTGYMDPEGYNLTTYYIIYCDNSIEIKMEPLFSSGLISCAKDVIQINRFAGGSLYRTSGACICQTPTPTPTSYLTPTPTPTSYLTPTPTPTLGGSQSKLYYIFTDCTNFNKFKVSDELIKISDDLLKKILYVNATSDTQEPYSGCVIYEQKIESSKEVEYKEVQILNIYGECEECISTEL